MKTEGKGPCVLPALAAILAFMLAVGTLQANAQEPTQSEKRDERPNILLIVADDPG